MWKRFFESVRRHFGFLETEFGFAQKAVKPPTVIFESDKLRLLIVFDESRGNELDLAIRRFSDETRKPLSVGIDTLMRFADGRNSPGYPPAFPTTEEAVEAEVRRLAELLRKYGRPLLD